MGDIMTFPKRWEDFLHDYEFEDARRIYTNGSRLIPSFRVKQMMEHYASVVHGRWLEVREKRLFGEHYFLCSNCKSRNGLMIPFNYCPNCGSKMDGEP